MQKKHLTKSTSFYDKSSQQIEYRRSILGNSLMVQWLGLGTLTARGLGLIPGWRTKILQATRCSQKKRSNILQHNKSHIRQTHSLHHTYGERLKDFPLRSGTKHGGPLLPLLFNIVLEVLARSVRHQKEIVGLQIRKEVKLFLFTDDMILYIENPKDVTKKTVRTNKFSKISAYKISMQKSVEFLHSNNELSEK